MKIRINMIIAVIVTFLLTASIFMAIPTESQSTKTYNPLADINEDGKVSLADLILLANAYGTNGTPVNITDLQSQIRDLQNRVSTLAAQASYVKTLRFYTPNETMTNDTTWKDAAIFNWTPQNATNNALIQFAYYFQYLTNDSNDYQLVFRILINGIITYFDSEVSYNSTYQQQNIRGFFFSSGDFGPPDQTAYTIEFQVHTSTGKAQQYVRNINILLEVMDGLPPS